MLVFNSYTFLNYSASKRYISFKNIYDSVTVTCIISDDLLAQSSKKILELKKLFLHLQTLKPLHTFTKKPFNNFFPNAGVQITPETDRSRVFSIA